MRLANLGLIDGFAVDLVVSGINHGSNLGDDITYSGTVAAALEAIVLGLPGIAVSQQSRSLELDFRSGSGFDFTVAADFTARLVDELETVPLPAATLLNINVPGAHPSGVTVAGLGKRIYRDELALMEEDPAHPDGGRRLYRIYGDATFERDEQGTDLAAVAAGQIAVTPLHFDLTARDGLDALARHDLARLLAPGCRRGDGSVSVPKAAAKRAAELRRELEHHGYRYYVLDDPDITDDQYDALLDELRALEAEYPELVTPDSPTQRVGGEPVSDLVKVTPSRADAVTGQRALGRGAARLDPADAQPPGARGDRGPAV